MDGLVLPLSLQDLRQQPDSTKCAQNHFSQTSPRSPQRGGGSSGGHRSPMRESVSNSKLYRDISPTRVFTHSSPDSSRVGLPDLFKQKCGLVSLRPSYSLAFGPGSPGEDGSTQPKLLRRLEELLSEKLSLVQQVGAASKGFAATQMRTDAFRQVFDAFLHSFTTYRGLLGRVKSTYDIALDDALASVYDNVHMRAELTEAEQRMDTAVRLARHKALEDAAEQRKEIQDEVEQQEAIAAEAERRVQEADKEISAIKADIARLHQEERELMRANAARKQQLLANSSWATPQLLARYDTPQADRQKKGSESMHRGS